MKKLSQNFTWIALANIISGVLNGLIFIYLARALGTSALGMFSYAQSAAFFLYNFLDLGLSTYGIREIAKQKEHAFEYVSNIISLRLIIASMLFVVFLILIIVVPENPHFKILLSLTLLLLFSNALATEWAFQGIEKMHMVFISLVTTVTLQFLLLFIFVKSAGDLLLVPVILFISALPIIIIFLWLLKFRLKIKNIDFLNIKVYLKSSLIIWLISLFAQVYNGLDIFILGLFKPSQVVGYFSVARRFVGGIILFTVFLANAALPRLSCTFKEGSKEFCLSTSAFIKLAIILGICLFVPFVLFADKIISLTFGKEYLPAAASFKILMLGAILVILNLPFSTALIAAGFERDVLKQTIASAILSLTLNFTLIPRFKFGMLAASVSFFYAEALALVWIIFIHYKKLRPKIII